MALGSIPIILVGVEKGKIMREGERRKKRKKKRGRMNELMYLQMNTMIIVNTE